MLHKSFEIVETKALEGEGVAPGTFSAVVAVFGNVDRVGDRIADKAFDETLDAWRTSGDPIPIILSHDHTNAWAHVGTADPHDVKAVPGRGLVLEKGVLDVDTNPLAAQVHRLMKRRSLKEFSFGYRVPPGGQKRAKDGAYDLTKLDLVEFGPTLKGVNPDTELLEVKSDLEAHAAEERATLVERVEALEARVKAWADVAMPGTFEEVQKAVSAAIRALHSGDNEHASVVATFPDRVLYTVSSSDGDSSYEAGYAIGEDGVAALSDVREVEIEASVTEKDEEIEGKDDAAPPETKHDEQDDDAKIEARKSLNTLLLKEIVAREFFEDEAPGEHTDPE